MNNKTFKAEMFAAALALTTTITSITGCSSGYEEIADIKAKYEYEVPEKGISSTTNDFDSSGYFNVIISYSGVISGKRCPESNSGINYVFDIDLDKGGTYSGSPDSQHDFLLHNVGEKIIVQDITHRHRKAPDYILRGYVNFAYPEQNQEQNQEQNSERD